MILRQISDVTGDVSKRNGKELAITFEQSHQSAPMRCVPEEGFPSGTATCYIGEVGVLQDPKELVHEGQIEAEGVQRLGVCCVCSIEAWLESFIGLSGY